jgi:uncharacterized protein HemX
MVKIIVAIVAVALIAGLLLYHFVRQKKGKQQQKTGMRVSKFGHHIREEGERPDTTPSSRPSSKH